MVEAKITTAIAIAPKPIPYEGEDDTYSHFYDIIYVLLVDDRVQLDRWITGS